MHDATDALHQREEKTHIRGDIRGRKSWPQWSLSLAALLCISNSSSLQLKP